MVQIMGISLPDKEVAMGGPYAYSGFTRLSIPSDLRTAMVKDEYVVRVRSLHDVTSSYI